MQGKLIYQFGPYRLDPEEHLLSKDGRFISLSPQLFNLLIVFVENAGHLISKEELRNKLWGKAFVSEDALKVIIGNLRKALGDGQNGDHYIENVFGKGYRFIGPVKMAEKGDSQGNIQDTALTVNGEAVMPRDPASSGSPENASALAEPGVESPAPASTGASPQTHTVENHRIILWSFVFLIAAATLFGLVFWLRSNKQSQQHLQSDVPAPTLLLYDFEDGEQGWIARPGMMISRVFSSDVHAYEGKRSLAIVFDNPYARKSQVYVTNPPIKAGRTVTARILCPADTQLASIAWFVEDREYTWSNDWQPVSRLIPGGWNRFAVRIPADAPTPLERLGIEFTADAAWKGTCYLDAVEWQ